LCRHTAEQLRVVGGVSALDAPSVLAADLVEGVGDLAEEQEQTVSSGSAASPDEVLVEEMVR
jgi:hypothetical protein